MGHGGDGREVIEEVGTEVEGVGGSEEGRRERERASEREEVEEDYLPVQIRRGDGAGRRGGGWGEQRGEGGCLVQGGTQGSARVGRGGGGRGGGRRGQEGAAGGDGKAMCEGGGDEQVVAGESGGMGGEEEEVQVQVAEHTPSAAIRDSAGKRMPYGGSRPTNSLRRAPVPQLLPSSLHESYSVCIPWTASITCDPSNLGAPGVHSGAVGGRGGVQGRGDGGGIPRLALSKGLSTVEYIEAIGRWGEALVYQMLKLTRPRSVVEWLNLNGESKGFYDLSVTSLEPGNSDVDMSCGSRPECQAPIRRPKLSTVEYIEVKTTTSQDKNVCEISLFYIYYFISFPFHYCFKLLFLF